MRELKLTLPTQKMQGERRTPHGVRELKCRRTAICTRLSGRTPHGVRELKSFVRNTDSAGNGRTPHGVRELKLSPNLPTTSRTSVAPRMGCVS